MRTPILGILALAIAAPAFAYKTEEELKEACFEKVKPLIKKGNKVKQVNVEKFQSRDRFSISTVQSIVFEMVNNKTLDGSYRLRCDFDTRQSINYNSYDAWIKEQKDVKNRAIAKGWMNEANRSEASKYNSQIK